MTNVARVRIVGEVMKWYVQNRTACTTNMLMNAAFLLVMSEIQAQNIRPMPLPMAMTPTRVAAVAALTLPISWKIGAAWDRTDNPAMVLIDMRPQSAHHCHVPRDSPSVKSRSERWDNSAAFGCQLVGCQPSGGFCMKSPESTATMPNAIPRYAKVGISPTVRMSSPAIGAEMSAPVPKPPTAMPVIRPRRSGNHLTRTAIGTI